MTSAEPMVVMGNLSAGPLSADTRRKTILAAGAPRWAVSASRGAGRRQGNDATRKFSSVEALEVLERLPASSTCSIRTRRL